MVKKKKIKVKVRAKKSGVDKTADAIKKEYTSLVKSLKKKVSKEKVTSIVSQKKLSATMKRAIDIGVNLARELRGELPPEMIKAIDLEVGISILGLTLEVDIDLEQIPKS